MSSDNAGDDFPMRDYMAAAFCIFGWIPEIFWSATLPEFWAAFDGHRITKSGRAAAPPSRAEFEEMMRRFPD